VSEFAPDGLDINLACHAPAIRKGRAGSGLFEDAAMLSAVLGTVRRRWGGLLTVKIRLGRDAPGWEAAFAERLRLFEDSGVDAVILHPRFLEEKFKRRARHELYAWTSSLTRLPLIASGDITGEATLRRNAALFQPVSGVMVGRMAVARPWVFAAWERPLEVDLAGVWFRMHAYISEDFRPGQALARIKMFTEYYARNFVFGHTFGAAVRTAPTLDAARERAAAFFAGSPALDPEPSLTGL
jgi:tRNA-dihydrouridine synthase B